MPSVIALQSRGAARLQELDIKMRELLAICLLNALGEVRVVGEDSKVLGGHVRLLGSLRGTLALDYHTIELWFNVHANSEKV